MMKVGIVVHVVQGELMESTDLCCSCPKPAGLLRCSNRPYPKEEMHVTNSNQKNLLGVVNLATTLPILLQ